MKVLLAYNLHRGGGGSDDAAIWTERLLRTRDVEVEPFVRDSSQLPPGLKGRSRAATAGVYARDAVRRFRVVLERFAPDVVHAHELYPLISPWVMASAHTAGVPVVMTCHDYRLTCPIATHFSNGALCFACMDGSELSCVTKNCRGNRLESAAYALRSRVARSADLVMGNVSVFITPTDFARRWLVEKAAVPEQQTVTIPYGIRIPSEPVDPAAGTAVGYAGRFVPEKGIATLLAAARATGLPLRIAGDISDMPWLAAETGVEVAGRLDSGGMAEFYRSLRMLVVPSTWFETFGIVAGEAMSHGVPVIASRIGALAEVVDDGRTGVLVPPGDAASLANAMRAVWDDPAAARRMGSAGRDKIMRECHEDVHFERLMKAYQMAASLASADRAPASPRGR
jgi:glycosyltransferase involved in cell wall biosynthesis